jgi:hypothetical protein
MSWAPAWPTTTFRNWVEAIRPRAESFLELRRDGESLWAVADDLERELTLPDDAVYIAWALKEERHARVGHGLAVFFGGMFNSFFESLFDFDDDDDYAYASESSSSSSSDDRGKRYARKDEPERVRTRP